jgi:hypothetical protein
MYGDKLMCRIVAPQLGTKTADLDDLDKLHKNKKQEAIKEAVDMRNQMEDDGINDRHEHLQSARPEVDDDLINAEIDILYSYVELDGSTKNMWCQGKMLVVRTPNRIHIEWDASTLREGDEPITEEVLLKSKYNKHVIGVGDIVYRVTFQH